MGGRERGHLVLCSKTVFLTLRGTRRKIAHGFHLFKINNAVPLLFKGLLFAISACPEAATPAGLGRLAASQRGQGRPAWRSEVSKSQDASK